MAKTTVRVDTIEPINQCLGDRQEKSNPKRKRGSLQIRAPSLTLRVTIGKPFPAGRLRSTQIRSGKFPLMHDDATRDDQLARHKPS